MKARNAVAAFRLISAGLLLTCALAFAAPAYVWWEGEKTVADNFPKKTSFSETTFRDTADLLSGRAWLCNEGVRTGPEAYARYSVTVPTNATFKLYVRKFWLHGPFKWRFDQADWAECGRDVHLLDAVPIRQFLNANWVYLGNVTLSNGPHAFELRLTAKEGESQAACFDAFYLTTGNVAPFGNKPPESYAAKSNNGPAEWYPILFGDDTFSPDSVIDMSSYVDAPAGQHGRLVRQGDMLTFENTNAPVKFWGCGANLQPGTKEEQVQRARYLVKHGINMIRQHPVFDALGPLKNGAFDPQRLDAWDAWCALLKEHGIYMTWSLFYPLEIAAEDGYDPELFAELPSRGPLRSTSGLVNIEPKLQQLELNYMAALLNHTNKYTGLRYADDPLLAVLEIHNEDCVFWGNPLNQLHKNGFPNHAKRLRQKWCAWVHAKYGSEAAVIKAWGSLRKDESLARGELGLFASYHLGPQGPLYEMAGQTKRAGDFICFLAELQKNYYDAREKATRALGFKGVTVTTAWRAGGAAADPANTFCDSACDMIDRHNYAGGGAGGHDIRLGSVNNTSHLAMPGGGLLAIGMYQVENHPFACTEWTQSPPNEWKLEAAPLFAFYGLGLQGWDASYHFANGRSALGNGWPGMRSYATDTPHYLGQFPALFFALHFNHIKQAPVAAARRLKPQDLFRGVDALNQDFTGGGYDNKALQGALATPAELLAIGKVTTSFAGGTSTQINVTKYWNKTKKVVRSMTGELAWDYGREVVLLNTPKTAAIVGKTENRQFDLLGVSAKIKTPFVSLIFTPLDNQELSASTNILITALARDTQTGAEYARDEKTGATSLVKLGAAPLLLEPVQATLKLKGAPPAQINVLDPYGVPTGKQVNATPDGSFTIDGRYMTYYYQVRR